MSTDIMSDDRQKKVMAGIVKRRDIIKTQITMVAAGYTNALFVYGPAGLGKTHLITDVLEACFNKAYQHHTAYSTPKALMMTIAGYPSQVHLFEDCEKLYKTDIASSILRAACGSPKQKDRLVTYETAHELLRVKFSGGIIIVSNEDISRSKGPLMAVASRFRPIKWDLTIEERIACILEISKSGWQKGVYVMNPAECRKVAVFLVEQMTQGDIVVPVDLRTFTEHALPTYCQFRDSKVKGEGWKDIIVSKLAGQVLQMEKRDQRGTRLETLALMIDSNKKMTRKQRMEKWRQETGLGQAIFYRHLKRAKSTGSK
jgi:hypothetical protein